jgi:amino acid adenylation domain-containing protein
MTTLLQLADLHMSAHPGSIAVVHDGRSLSYGQLRGEVGRIAQALMAAGIRPGSLVAIYLNRSPQLLAALLGTWRAGAAYLPLDPTHPPDRNSFMVEDSRVDFVLSEMDLLPSAPQGNAKLLDLDSLITGLPQAALRSAPVPDPEGLAYVIYTSGSTGRPKGVKISHGALANTLLAVQQDLQLQPHDVMLACNSIAFDISGLEFYLPLISGGSLHMIEREAAADGHQLMRALRESRATIMIGLATRYRLLLAAGWQGHPDLQLTIGGEVVSMELARQLTERSRALWNHYGPTEASICATSEKILPGVTRITLGRPLNNVQVYVLDQNLKPLPAGETGEIYIGGGGVGQGYLNRPELTKACFLHDPFHRQPGATTSATMYKTGDLGAILPDGRLDFVGRVDEQVKIRGYRIELGEIESALEDCPGIEAAVVRAIEFAPDDKRLIAFVISHQTPEALRARLRRSLPDYMIPSEYIVLSSFPVTPNGKVDRLALDALRLKSAASSPPGPASDHFEAGLKEIWQALFKIGSVRTTDNFLTSAAIRCSQCACWPRQKENSRPGFRFLCWPNCLRLKSWQGTFAVAVSTRLLPW